MAEEQSSNSSIGWLGKIGAELVDKVPGGPLATISLVLIIAVLGMTLVLAVGGGPILAVVWLGFVVVLLLAGSWVLKEYREDEAATVRQLGELTVEFNVFDLANDLDAEERKQLLEVLRRVRSEAADHLNVSVANVRSNIFGLSSYGDLRIIPGFDDNLSKPEERTIALLPGMGNTGIAFQAKRPSIAILKENWGLAAVSGSELLKLDPRLRWIVSVPVLNADDVPPICVLNVDGFDELDAEQLSSLIIRLTTWATFVGLQFAAVAGQRQQEARQ